MDLVIIICIIIVPLAVAFYVGRWSAYKPLRTEMYDFEIEKRQHQLDVLKSKKESDSI